MHALWNNLELYKRLLQYRVVEKKIAYSAIAAFDRHQWYLTVEIVSLALFSNRVPLSERQAHADALNAVKPLRDLQAPVNRLGLDEANRKPKFSTSQIDASTRLCDRVREDSWFTVYRLQLDASFLQHSASE